MQHYYENVFAFIETNFNVQVQSKVLAVFGLYQHSHMLTISTFVMFNSLLVGLWCT